MRKDSKTFEFSGFESPNYTQVPDELFDQLLPQLSGAELKALLYIIRRTFGFKRESDTISLSQMLSGIRGRDGQVLDRGTGLSKPALLQALRTLEGKRIIHTERRRSVDKGDEPTIYRLCVKEESGGKESLPPVVKKVVQGGGQESLPGPWSKKLTQQQTVLQETELSISRQFSTSPGETVSAPTPSGATGGFASFKHLLATSASWRRIQEVPAAERQAIRAYVADLARDLGDEANILVSLNQVLILFRRSGLEVGPFISTLLEARSRLREHTKKIRKRRQSPDGRGAANQFPYYLAIVEDLLGLRPEAAKGR